MSAKCQNRTHAPQQIASYSIVPLKIIGPTGEDLHVGFDLAVS
jgi:hypothetical protein